MITNNNTHENEKVLQPVLNEQEINNLWDLLLTGESKKSKSSLNKIRKRIEAMPENRQIEIYTIILDGLIKRSEKSNFHTLLNENLMSGFSEPLILGDNKKI